MRRVTSFLKSFRFGLALTAAGSVACSENASPSLPPNLIRLELATNSLGRLPHHLERYLRSRQPSREILARAGTVLGSDLQLLWPEQNSLLDSLQAALGPRRP